MNAQERCSTSGCTLASAFFPDSGQHELKIYPTMFEQSLQEQIETLAHELGHVFGSAISLLKSLKGAGGANSSVTTNPFRS